MVLVILLTNVLIRKREMMKVTQNANTHIKAKELQIKFLRKDYSPKKTSHHQMRMKSVTVGRVLFMALKDSDKEDSEEEYEEAEE
jgi:pyrimidine operon attenuation protein/uracil phosphoribosyltransferase